jgi:hypothetical protein
MKPFIPMLLLTLFVPFFSASSLLYGQRVSAFPRISEAYTSSAGAGQHTNTTTTVTTNAETPRRLTHWHVRVFYVDGRMIEGVVALAHTDYVIDYTENGNRFYKRLSIAETASIRVNRWKPQIASGDERRTLYFFMPELYRIIARDGEVYRLDKRMKMLDSFELRTPRGSTRVYLYFADYWTGASKEDDGQWENSGSRNFNHNNTRPHPETVYRIDFISEQPY